jgi:hypothetical protein
MRSMAWIIRKANGWRVRWREEDRRTRTRFFPDELVEEQHPMVRQCSGMYLETCFSRG